MSRIESPIAGAATRKTRTEKLATPSPAGAPPETSARGFRIGFLVHDVSRLRRSLFDQWMKPKGITRAQWWLLTNMSRRLDDGMTQTELARVMDISKGNVGALVDRLEKTGHVERRSEPADRRINRVFVTSKGRSVLKEMTAVSKVLNVKILRGLESERIEVAEAILHRIKETLIELLEEPAVEPVSSPRKTRTRTRT